MARRRTLKTGAPVARRRVWGFETLESRAMLSLTHLYTFNDGTARDWVGSAHGSLVNGASIVNGRLLLQNGAVPSGRITEVQYAQLHPGVLPNGAATIEVWFVASNAAAWSRVFDIGNPSGASGDSYLFITPQSGAGDSRAVLRPSGAAERVGTGPSTADANEHMAAVVIDVAAGFLRYYVDGTPHGTASLAGASGGAISDAVAFLGRSLFSGDPGFSGAINELRIYDDALPAGVIAAHAAAGPIANPFFGDLNNDNAVDGSDLLAWQQSVGSTTSLAADANFDGMVDASDLAVWQSNFGRAATGPTAALTIENESRTFATLTNVAVTMTGQSELRLTGAGNPIAGSIVNLDSADAWLFFTNVAPSAVNAAFLSQIRVNGAPAVRGGNVRVVQYELGTVVIPHAPTFQPLQAFHLPNFAGTTQAYGQYAYYDTAGEFGLLNLNISSFKLKRGYMATIATQANGSGLSKVYVAQDHDLDVSILPAEFDNQIRYLYVTPWRWVSKKGASDLAPEVLDAAWHYNWDNNRNSTLDIEYVPIRQQRWWPGYPFNKPDTTTLLGYNEPNNPVEDAYETLGNGSVDAAIAAWPELMATGQRLGSPAVTDGGKAWLYEFMNKAIAANLRVDFIAIHNYQAGHSAASLQAWLKDVWDRYHLPIWLTEFNNGANWTGGADPTYAQNATAIGSFINMMDDTPWIERYSIYSRVEAVREMTYADGTLTPAGQVYHDNASPIGYVQQGVPASNSAGRSIAQYQFDGNALDSSGYGNNGQTIGGVSYTAGQHGEAIEFDGVHNSLRLNNNVASGNEFSFAGWVYWDGGGNWQRIFDFGNDTQQYLFLTPSNGGNMRFAIKNGGAEQIVQTSPLPVGQWTHVAVTLGGGVATLYVNGAQAAANAVTIRPGDFDPQVNFLGDSQFAADPLFRGRLDDVHIADYVLTPTQIAELMSNTAPQFGAASIVRGPALRGTPFNDTVAGLATDADAGDTLTYSKIKGPAWLAVAADGTLSGTPPATETARQEFVLRATDSRGASAFTEMTVFLTTPASEAASFATATASAGDQDELTGMWGLAQLMSVDAAFDDAAEAVLAAESVSMPSSASVRRVDIDAIAATRVARFSDGDEAVSQDDERDHVDPPGAGEWSLDAAFAAVLASL